MLRNIGAALRPFRGTFALLPAATPTKQSKITGQAKPQPEKKTAPAPSGFRVTKDGVFYAGEDGEARPVCSRLEILARTRDEKGHGWGLLVEFDDPDGANKRLNIPARAMAGDFGKEVLAPLVDMGLRLAPVRTARNSRNDLQSYLQGYDSAERARLVTRLGWHGDAYLLPDRQIGRSVPAPNICTSTKPLPSFSRSLRRGHWNNGSGKSVRFAWVITAWRSSYAWLSLARFCIYSGMSLAVSTCTAIARAGRPPTCRWLPRFEGATSGAFLALYRQRTGKHRGGALGRVTGAR